MNKPIITAYAVSNVGKIRENNEDSFSLNGNISDGTDNCNCLIENSDTLICCVCDGMGGEEFGEIASKTALNSIIDSEKELSDSNLSSKSVHNALMKANDSICKENASKKVHMGSTIAFLGVKGNRIIAANIGDSRIYQYYDGQLKQISKDHTREQFLIDAGLASNSEYDHHVLTQHLGIPKSEMEIEPFIQRPEPDKDILLLLCSDGLYDMVSDLEIKEIISNSDEVKKAAEELKEKALNNGGYDNITVIIVKIEN